MAVEVWHVPAEGIARLLLQEPPGLCIGKVRLADGSETLGVIGEPALCAGRREITSHGGWRAYVASRAGARVMGVFDRRHADRERIGMLMGGHSSEATPSPEVAS